MKTLVLCFSFILFGCSEFSIPVTQGQSSEKEEATRLKGLYEQYSADPETKTMQDFRQTINLNPAIVLVDSIYNDSLNQGGTSIYYNGRRIWSNSWNGAMSTQRMRTIVEHGYSWVNDLYFLYIVNNSATTSGGVWTEYKLYKIECGNLIEMDLFLFVPIHGIQEIPGGFVIHHGGGSTRNPRPYYFSFYERGENIQNYCLNCP